MFLKPQSRNRILFPGARGSILGSGFAADIRAPWAKPVSPWPNITRLTSPKTTYRMALKSTPSFRKRQGLSTPATVQTGKLTRSRAGATPYVLFPSQVAFFWGQIRKSQRDV